MGGIFSAAEVQIADDSLAERDGGFDSADDGFIESALHTGDGRGAVWADGNQFSDHRIVERRDGVAAVDVRVHPDADAAGGVVKVDRAGGGSEIVGGILRVDAEFDGVSQGAKVIEFGAEAFAGSDFDLLFDQVDPVDLFGHRMFDLDAGIHFEKVKVTGIINEELHRTGVFVLNGFGQFDGGFPHAFAEIAIEKGGGRFFEKFLVAALDRAVAFADMDNFTALIAEDLEFDVVGFLNIFFQIDVGISEGFFCFHACGEEAFDEADVIVSGSHSFASAPRDGFDHDGIADLLCGFDRFLLGSYRAIASWGDGDAGFAGIFSSEGFISHSADRFGRGTDEADVAGLANFGEVGVFGEESVARVNGVNVSNFGGGDDSVDFQITLSAGTWPDTDGFIGGLDVEGVVICLGVNGEGADAHVFAGTDDAKCDFAPICDKNFFKHIGVAEGVPRRGGLGWADAEERLSELDRLSAFDKDFGNRA